MRLLGEPRYRHLFAGLLCTIDVDNDPVAVYDALVALDPPRVDFLLPHATWDTPPPRPPGRDTPYADWLGAVFDRWTEQGRPVPVRFFDSVLRTLRGQSSLTESLGLDPADLVVIETDGTLEQADSLKVAYDGAPATGLDVFSHSLDDAARHPGVAGRSEGLAALATQCRACPVVRSCGGGLYAHRYRTGSGFDNPSVFCADLLQLITGIRDGEAVLPPGTAVPPGTALSPAADAERCGPVLTDRHIGELATGFGGAAGRWPRSPKPSWASTANCWRRGAVVAFADGERRTSGGAAAPGEAAAPPGGTGEEYGDRDHPQPGGETG